MKTYYECEGSVRGSCGHQHRTCHAAQACIDRDQSGCASQGGYSDRSIYLVREDGTREIMYEGTNGGWYTKSEMDREEDEEAGEMERRRKDALSLAE